MGSSGLLQAWKIKNWPQPSTNCSSAGRSVSAGLDELYGAFLILFICLTLATFTLLIESIAVKLSIEGSAKLDQIESKPNNLTFTQSERIWETHTSVYGRLWK